MPDMVTCNAAMHAAAPSTSGLVVGGRPVDVDVDVQRLPRLRTSTGMSSGALKPKTLEVDFRRLQTVAFVQGCSQALFPAPPGFT